MKLYEFAVIYTPLQTKEQHDRGEKPKSELIVDVTRVLAGSDKEAMMLAARAIPDKYTGQLEQVEIALRPF
jgi:hypothetical protein